MTLPIKIVLPIEAVTSVLKDSTNVITSITSHLVLLTLILVIMSVSNIKTAVILYVRKIC